MRKQLFTNATKTAEGNLGGLVLGWIGGLLVDKPDQDVSHDGDGHAPDDDVKDGDHNIYDLIFF